MKFLSVCSGIEAASCAWKPLGWEAFAFAEIENFPSAVLAHHYPDVPNFGDMSKFGEWPDAAVDIFVGGTPCQSFSVAGLRKGLDDPRGNLMLTYLAIARRYRPRWLVWENVPGVLSSNGGRDFAAFLRGLDELGYGWAYRVLDAQYFGVAQRRRRVFVVGYLGDWRLAAAVLFERHSLCGHPAPSRKARKDTAGSTGDGVARCLTTGEAKQQDWETCNIVAHSLRGEGFDASEDGTGRGTPLVPVAFSSKDHGADALTDCSPTLRAGGHADSHANAGVPPAVAFAQNQCDEVRMMEVAGALAAEPGMKQQTYIAFQPGNLKRGCGSEPNTEVFPTLAASHGRGASDQDPHVAVASHWDGDYPHPTLNQSAKGSGGVGSSNQEIFSQRGAYLAPAPSMQVRRLTPRECERLQGFPDDYTQIPWRGKPADQCPDGPRYKALGNSMAVPVMRWIGERIAAVDEIAADVQKKGAA